MNDAIRQRIASDNLPGYQNYGGRPTQGELGQIQDQVDRAKNIIQLRGVFENIPGLDLGGDHLQLIQDLGAEWGKEEALKAATDPVAFYRYKAKRDAARTSSDPAAIINFEAEKQSLIAQLDPASIQRHEAEFAMRKMRQLFEEVIMFDLQHGTRTSGYIPIEYYKERFKQSPNDFAADANVEHGVRHRPSLTSVLRIGLHLGRQVLKEHNISERDVSFYDLGCGSGKPALYARMKCDFANVVGVDYFHPLLDIGTHNKRVLGFTDTTSNRIAFKFGDAATFTDYRTDNRHGAVIAYTYNSFGRPVVEAVRDNLERTGVPTMFIYNKQLHEDVFTRERGWREEHVVESLDDDMRLGIYTRDFGFA